MLPSVEPQVTCKLFMLVIYFDLLVDYSPLFYVRFKFQEEKIELCFDRHLVNI